MASRLAPTCSTCATRFAGGGRCGCPGYAMPAAAAIARARKAALPVWLAQESLAPRETQGQRAPTGHGFEGGFARRTDQLPPRACRPCAGAGGAAASHGTPAAKMRNARGGKIKYTLLVLKHVYDLYFKSFKGETPPVFSILGTPQLRPTGPARSYRCCSGLGSQQNLGVETVFRPRKRMRSFFLLKWGVQILLCLFCQNHTPRSDSANLEPPEPSPFSAPKF